MHFWQQPGPEPGARIRLLSRLETLERLVAHPVSLARFGDGEAGFVLERNAIAFQAYDARLADRLRAVLTDPGERVLVAYNNHFLQQDEWPIVLKYPRGDKVPSRYETVTAIVLMILVTVLVVEGLAMWMRKVFR